MPLMRGRSVRLGGYLHRDSYEAAPSGAASIFLAGRASGGDALPRMRDGRQPLDLARTPAGHIDQDRLIAAGAPTDDPSIVRRPIRPMARRPDGCVGGIADRPAHTARERHDAEAIAKEPDDLPAVVGDVRVAEW